MNANYPEIPDSSKKILQDETVYYPSGCVDDEDGVGYQFNETQVAISKAFHAGLLTIRDGNKEYKAEYVAFTDDGRTAIKKGEEL